MPINGLIKKFPSVYQFCNEDINKIVLLLRKGVSPYEYMYTQEIFDKTSLSNKKAFYSELYLEDNTDKDCTHVKKVFEKFNLKNVGDYHDLYVQTYLQMYLKTLKTSALKYMNLILPIFYQHQDYNGKLV